MLFVLSQVEMDSQKYTTLQVESKKINLTYNLNCL